MFLFYADRNDEAIAQFKKTLEIDPNYWVAHNGLGRVFILEKEVSRSHRLVYQSKRTGSRQLRADHSAGLRAGPIRQARARKGNPRRIESGCGNALRPGL
jgi:hypothetical protein